MNTGKPIIEILQYEKEKKAREDRRVKEKWCKSVYPRDDGFVCLKSPIRDIYSEPCTTADFENCPLRSRL